LKKLPGYEKGVKVYKAGEAKADRCGVTRKGREIFKAL
jgi:hypothetical protein